MKNKKLFLSMFFVFGILILISFVSAYTQSSYSSQYNNAMGLGIFSGAQSLRVDESMCQEGTDFLIQIGPLSCTPTVVRSDLLEEENVNVFCQLTATQINPFVDVKAIDWINFKKEYPREVLSMGYHPAQAALGYTEQSGLEGSAGLSNLGYVVITLKRQPNESALTNCEKTALGGEVCWVEGNLTARLRYDIENVFGVGKAVFYLPVMDDEEWQENYIQYSFWEGRGYLRAEAVGEDDASISVYSDTSVASGLSKRNREYNLARYSSNINLKEGESSYKIFLPGLSPCLASLKLTLNGIENPETRAILKINEDYVEVAGEEKFLENKCKVSGIEKKGISSEVKITCNGADVSSERKPFYLRIFPKVNLSINGKTKSYGVGDWLYKSEDGEKSVYLGYVGTTGDTTDVEDLYVYLVALPVHKESLADSEISSVANHAEGIMASSDTGANFWDKASDVGKKFAAATMQIGKWAIKGEAFNKISYKEKSVLSLPKNILGSSVSIQGFSNPEENGFMTLITTEYLLTEEKSVLYGEKYFFKDGDKVSEMFLTKSKSGAPLFFIETGLTIGINPNPVGPLIGPYSKVLGIFQGEGCTKHEDCLKYTLFLNSLDSSDYKSFFDNIVGAEVIPGENKLVIKRASFTEFEEQEEYLENYKNAMNDFETVVNSFSQEVEKENSLQTLGERALQEEIFLANKIGQKKTMLELCKKFEEDYPNSYRTLALCKDDLKLSSSEINVRDITINGITKSISFEGIKEPSINDYSATVLVQGPNGRTASYDLRKNKQVPLSGFREKEDEEKLQSTEYIMLTELESDSASIRLNLGDQKFFEKQFLSDTKSFKKGVSARYGGYTFTLTDVNLEKVAKVSITSREDFAESETDFKFKIGIEKRNTLLKLSPDRAQEKINSLNNSIAEWQKASDALYIVVKNMKAACIGAGAVLTFKNFIANYGGKSIARQKVMGGINDKGGWNEKCTELVSAKPSQYKSMDDCFLKNSDAIEIEVNELYEIMKIQDGEIKNIENVNMQKGSGLSQDYVNTTGFVGDYSEKVRQTLNSLSEEDKKNLDIRNIETILTLDGWKNNKYTIEQLREIELYSLYLKGGENDEVATKRLASVLSDIEVNAEKYVEENTFEKETGMEDNSLVDSFDKIIKMKEIQVVNRIQFKDTKYASMGIEGSEGITPSPADYVYAIKDRSTGKKYVTLYDIDGVVIQTYEIIKTGNIEKLQVYKNDKGDIKQNPFDLYFKKYDKASYENAYKASYGSSSVLLRYYETSPFKGLPSVVPFDINKGWYAGIKSPQTSYDASGVVKSFWVCNVAENGIEEFQLEGFGDDICQLFNLYTGQEYTNFPGLGESESYNLVIRAQTAIETAQKARARQERLTSVSIEGRKIKVGEPSVQTPAVQCTDFMSAKDCSLLFNLCDPVICPSSRCNLGGNYPVQNVIQSGIIGSMVLCYPNAKWNGGDVYVPVCLTGIQAGLDSWISIQKSYRDCLQTNLKTGETIGICDEINSIYTCEFFWKQALPIINSALPKLLGMITGQNKKGGGEYQGISSALETAKDSVDYFKQYYAADSYRAFKVRSTEQAGTEICSTFVSLTYPDEGSFLDNLIEPDSPVQFTGKFDEIQLTTVTNPPTSQYKVYYHIYAGKDSGAYYQVYLRGSGSSYYQDTAQRRIVKSDYIPRGGYASETIDFTAPSGYKELCIVVNGQEECDFKEVSTSFAVNYVSDLYLAEQTSTTDIKTEKECISGTSSLYSLLNLNVQSAAENIIDPSLYTQGIIRICSTDDPGVGTDASAGTESARWQKVGYCGDNKIGCWIDTESVKNVIRTMNIEENALKEVSKDYVGYLSKDYLNEESFNSKIDEIKKETSDTRRIELIGEILNKVFFNNQKAQLFFWRGKSYSNLAIAEYKIFDEVRKTAEEIAKAKAEAGAIPEEGEEIPEADVGLGSVKVTYPEYIFAPKFLNSNIHLKYNKEWYYCLGNILKIFADPCIDSANWAKTSEIKSLAGSTHKTIFEFMDDNLDKKNYEEGLIYLIDKAKQDKTSLAVKGEGFSVEMVSDGSFNLEKEGSSIDLIFKKGLSGENWKWKAHDSNIDKTGMDPLSFTFTPVLQSHLCGYCEGPVGACTPTLKKQIDKECELSRKHVKGFESFLPGLKDLDFYRGSKFIFEFFVSEVASGDTTIPSTGGVCTPPAVSPEISKITNARERVLKIAENLDGQSSSKALYSNCWEAAYYVYDSAGVLNKCVYSDAKGKQYTVQGIPINIGIDKKNGNIIYQIADSPKTQCSLNKQISTVPSEDQKLNNLRPGDLLSIVYDEDDGHNAIFIEWVDKTNRIAKLFDWNGADKNGNKIFRYYESSLNDNQHAVYMYWEPVIPGSSSTSLPAQTSTLNLDEFSDTEKEVITTATSCDNCGDKLFNLCDEKECNAIALKIGKNCVYTDYTIGSGSCVEK